MTFHDDLNKAYRITAASDIAEDFDLVFKSLRPVIVKERDTITKIIKQLTKDPHLVAELRKELLAQHGTALFADLDLLTLMIEGLK